MRTGKNFKVFGIRGSLIGDSIMALPILTFVEKQFPNSYKYWQIAKKCSQAAPLYFNHPLIDKIVISDCNEGMGPKDTEIAKGCDVVFNVMPQHPLQQDWPNYRNIYEETWVMAGLPMEYYNSLTAEEKRPKLYKWFDIEKQPKKTIALWPCAGYGRENTRNPSEKWYLSLITLLSKEGYNVIQFGHPNDYNFNKTINAQKEWFKINFNCFNGLPFFEQIKMSLGCDLAIATDSGSSLVLGAYEMPQITLLTNHFPNHIQNLEAFAPNNPNNINFVSLNGADNTDIFKVVEKVKEIVKL